MKIVIQRVLNAKCEIGGKVYSEINKGLLLYFGVEETDEISLVDKVVSKILKLRIFADQNGKTNLAIKDFKDYEILSISQFTLCANLNEGNRPSFKNAKDPKIAEEIYDLFCEKLNKEVTTKKGVFGADMKIEATNDGPFTIVLEMK